MQFNYIKTMVSQSPLDFNYKFGLNDNSPDKFRCDNITIMSKTFSTESVKSYVNQSYSLDLFSGLDDEETYEYEIPNVDSLSSVDDMSILSLEKQEKIYNNNNTFNKLATSIFNNTLNYANSLNSILGNNSNLAQGFGLANNLMSLTFGIFDLVQTINQSKDMYNSTKNSVNAQIDLLNEKTEANREFIQSLKDRQEQNKQKYISVSKDMV